MLSEAAVRDLLAPFELPLNSAQITQLIAYLELLLHWNRKINLTAVAGEKECVARHFGESLYVARWLELNDNLLDIGSGAGFPGLALKIVFPELRMTLLEPIAKKRAFLKEVVRVCRMDPVEVRGDRLEEFVRQLPRPFFAQATSRAVGGLEKLVPLAVKCLKPGGRLILWLGRRQAQSLTSACPEIEWGEPVALPLAREREIWIGKWPKTRNAS